MLELNATVLAVIINFLILVWVLNKVLYKPILKLIEDRQQYVEETVAKTEKEHKSAEALRMDYQQKIRMARLEEQKIMEEATKFADQIRKEGSDRARVEAEDIRVAAKHEADLIKQEAMESIRAEFVEVALRASEKMIGEELDEKKHRAMIMRVVEEARMS